MSYTARLESRGKRLPIVADAVHKAAEHAWVARACSSKLHHNLHQWTTAERATCAWTGFPQQTTSSVAVPVATIAVPDNQAREANDIFRRMRRSDKRRRER